MSGTVGDPLDTRAENRTENVQAHRIMNRGQRAYVEPQTCCDRKAPCTVTIKINGRTSTIPGAATPAGLRRLHKADARETTKRNGHSARSRSARSAGSLSIKSAIKVLTNGRDSREMDSNAKAGRAFRFKDGRSAPPRKVAIRHRSWGSS